MSMLNVPTFCIITGASRGIGRETAIQLSKKVAPNSLFFLVARSHQALQETARAIEEKSGENVEVRCLPTDLSDEASVAKLNHTIFGGIGDESRFGSAIIFHNAGSVIDVVSKHVRELNDIAHIQKFTMLSFTGPIAMTSEFLKVFGKPGSTARNIIIQTASFTAKTPTKTLHLYCSLKSARDMFFKVVALEEPGVRVLSFDPGFVETQLADEITTSVDKELVMMHEHVSKQEYYLKPAECVRGLIQTIEDDKYESGATVKCYDVLGVDCPPVQILFSTSF